MEADHFWGALIGDTRVRWGIEPDNPLMRTGHLLYLATPYKLRAMDAGVFDIERAGRAAADARQVLDVMLAAGISAVSPVVQGHEVIAARYRTACGWVQMADVGVSALDAIGWAQLNRPLLHASRAIYVPDIPGWRISEGIRREVSDVLRRNGSVFLRAPAVELV